MMTVDVKMSSLLYSAYRWHRALIFVLNGGVTFLGYLKAFHTNSRHFKSA